MCRGVYHAAPPKADALWPHNKGLQPERRADGGWPSLTGRELPPDRLWIIRENFWVPMSMLGRPSDPEGSLICGALVRAERPAAGFAARAAAATPASISAVTDGNRIMALAERSNALYVPAHWSEPVPDQFKTSCFC
jgi:hypothetical protein